MARPKVTLPCYDSMQECSHRTGIPVPALRKAKRSGCPAFTGSRVDLGQFLKWWFDNEEKTAVIDKHQEDALLTRERREFLALEKAKLNDSLVDVSEFEDRFWSDVLAPLRAEIERLPGQLAPLLRPSDPDGARIMLREAVERIKKNIKEPNAKKKRDTPNDVKE